MTAYRYKIDGIDCQACAKELETEIAKIPGITACSLVFGIHSHLQYEYEGDAEAEAEAEMRRIIEEDQEHPIITKEGSAGVRQYKYAVKNIDCADCAQILAEKTEKIAGVQHAQADFMQETLSFSCDPKEKKRIVKEMTAMIRKEEPEAEVSEFSLEHQSDEETEDTKTMAIRLLAGAVLFVAGLFLQGIPQIILSLASYIVLGYDVIWKAVRNIGHGQLFDENFLMTVATAAAIYLQDWKEAAGVMLFYQIGEYFQAKAVEHSRQSIGELMDIRPEYAMVLENGEYIRKDPDEVRIDDIIRVKPGERVPLDGIVTAGSSSLNTASLTGESKPRDVDVNDEVISGSINQTGVLEIKVTKEYGESTVAKILELVENSDGHKAAQEKFITKFSKYYTPIVVFSAIAVMIIAGIVYQDINLGIERACTFLVISCPCALVISIPLSFFAGIGGLSSHGVLVKGADVIDSLAKVKQIVMDKTGTLTSGRFAVEEIRHASDKKQVLKDAAAAEHFSNHPIAQGIQEAYEGTFGEDEIQDVKEIPGRGLRVKYHGEEILAGNAKLMKEQKIAFAEESSEGTLVYVARNGIYEGCLILRDQLKADSLETVKKLQAEGKKCIILSGDSQAVTDAIGRKLGTDQAIGGCLPEDKVRTVQELMKQGLTAFVGDGVNDAPVIHAADVGFAMGGIGSDAAIEAADVVLMDDSAKKIPLAVTSAQRILRIANENIYGAIIIKVVILVLGAFGFANMWMAIFADTGVAMLCVLNSMRLLHIAAKS
jgi:Cd2+/Zn2+-exporting ATPase